MVLETTQNEEHHKLLKDSRSQDTEDKTAPQKREDTRASLAAKDKCFVSYFPQRRLCTAPGAGKV